MVIIDKTKLPRVLTDKYVLENETFKREVKPNPKDRIEIEIGDSKQPDFKPQFKFMRWDNEVNFSLRAEEKAGAIVETEGEKIKYITPDYEIHLYDKPEVSEDGGFEFEWVLKQKPASNILQATIQTKGLNFFFQPPLTQAEIDEGAFRPEYITGGYVAYHKTKGGMNRADGMEYKVGKAFEIYVPVVTDANGNTTKGILNINEQTSLLTVTIDQTWLDNAVYPVVVDPTFGYTTSGATTSTMSSTAIIGTLATLSETGTLTSMTFGYNALWSSGENYKGGIFDSGGNYLDYETGEDTAEPAGNTQVDFISQPQLTAADYLLCFWTSGSFNIKADTGSSGNVIDSAGQTYPTWPASVTHSSTFIKTIYATYTAAGGAAVVDNSFMTTRTKFWGG